MKIINSATEWEIANGVLMDAGFAVSSKTPDGWIYKNKDTFEFVKLEYKSRVWRILKPENIGQSLSLVERVKKENKKNEK